MQTEEEWGKSSLLLRLLLDGFSTKAMSTAEASSLVRLGWAQPVRGRLEARSAAEIRRRLESMSPGLEAAAIHVRSLGLDPFSQAGHRMAARSLRPTPSLPAELSRKVARALLKPHSKHPISDAEAAGAGVARLLGDGLFRVRCRTPLTLAHSSGTRLDLEAQTLALGEAAIPERFLEECTGVCGHPQALVMVENAGSFTELPLSAGMMAVHVPGSDVGASRLLRLLQGVPVLHFGDWDQKGRETAARVQEACAAAGCAFSWMCPAWLCDYVATHAMKTRGAEWRPPYDRLPYPADMLASRGLWIEQEAVTLDPRLPDLIEQTVAALLNGPTQLHERGRSQEERSDHLLGEEKAA